MTKDEKKMLEANKNLVDKNTELFRDILILVKYIDGLVSKENIEEMLNYYRSQREKRGYKHGSD